MILLRPSVLASRASFLALSPRLPFDLYINSYTRRHKFWSHESNHENLIFKVWAEPQGLDNSFDEKFIRNLIGYQRDCQMANIEPSLFQLALIAYDSATLATPPFWIPFWLLSSVQYIMAYLIGGYVLGYVAVHKTLPLSFIWWTS